MGVREPHSGVQQSLSQAKVLPRLVPQVQLRMRRCRCKGCRNRGRLRWLLALINRVMDTSHHGIRPAEIGVRFGSGMELD